MTEENKPLELTEADFDKQALKAAQPVLVDFWAAWCGPCQIQGPVVEAMVEKFAGRAVIAKLNVDQNPQVASRYGIMSIPTLIIFKGGAEAQRFVGVQQEAALSEALEKAAST